MPICTIYLLSLNVPIPQFLHSLSSTTVKPLVVSKVIRWIILPTSTSTSALLAHNIHWDILLIIPSTDPLPQALQKHIQHQWSLQSGVPSRILQDFAAKNKALLSPSKGSVPPLTGSLDKARLRSSSQDLELSSELLGWAESFGKQEGSGAVSMLNLLAFKPDLKSEYMKYGAEFARSAGSKRGGTAKIVGSVIHNGRESDGGEGWDEVALAHYPSISHFADMLASEDYQDINKRYRVESLRDTFILCTSELGIDHDQGGLWRKGMGSKL
ncbi:hypothetical protein D0Z07_6105 [Hyphodiscus hymeniophilus]|uniref:DUF1330 domain-containing protein n=1 Tax=Hyphodiscus hymeniophilus TaxID=353542 RepID=A0A9P6VF86_9HELO|nr:hypothetical protein D0Z07_6105 [Hyphodiscus hymeniophilus]